MKCLTFIVLFILCTLAGMSQSLARLFQYKENQWNNIYTFKQDDLLVSTDCEITFQNSSSLPVGNSSQLILYFIFPDNTYFLIETKNVFTSTFCSYPFIQLTSDSIRPQKYKVYLPHSHDIPLWKSFVEKWNKTNSDFLCCEKPFMEIGSSYVVYDGDTVNVYDEQHQKDGKWVVYSINNEFREDSTTFFLPFDITIIAEQQFEHGEKNGVWTGYYQNGKQCFICTFDNDKLVNGTFFRGDSRIRYKFLYQKKDKFVFRDFANSKGRITISYQELKEWLRY